MHSASSMPASNAGDACNISHFLLAVIGAIIIDTIADMLARESIKAGATRVSAYTDDRSKTHMTIYIYKPTASCPVQGSSIPSAKVESAPFVD